MATWLSDATDEAEADIDALIVAVTQFASPHIVTAGHFAPFAVAVSVDGQLQTVQPNIAGLGELEISDQRDAQWQAIAELKESLRAAAVAVSVTLPNDFQDGIEITAEHQEGVAIGLVIRYRVGADRALEFDTPTAYPEEHRLWLT